MLAKSAAATTLPGGDAHLIGGRRARRRHRVRGDVLAGHQDPRPGLTVERFFTRQGVDPFDTVEWELRDAVISGADGKVFFEQRGVEFPRPWSQTATNVVVQKYFRGTLGTPQRENSVRAMIGARRRHDLRLGQGRRLLQDARRTRGRSATSWSTSSCTRRWRSTRRSGSTSASRTHPQCSACFINSVDDSMGSILGLAKTEGMLFKYGSGTGSNLSVAAQLARAPRTAAAPPRGPVSFMRGFDAFAGAIRVGRQDPRARPRW